MVLNGVESGEGFEAPVQEPVWDFKEVPKDCCKNTGEEIISVSILAKNHIRDNNSKRGIKTGFTKEFKLSFFSPTPAKIPMRDKIEYGVG